MKDLKVLGARVVLEYILCKFSIVVLDVRNSYAESTHTCTRFKGLGTHSGRVGLLLRILTYQTSHVKCDIAQGDRIITYYV